MIFFGLYVFIFVLNVLWFILEEQNLVNYFVKYFGYNIFKFIIILFICKDDFDEDKKILFDYIMLFLLKLRDFIEKCGG